VRLFVAGVPEPAALDHLDRALEAVRRLPGGPRWIDRARWHLTMVFVGELAEDRADRLATALGALPAGHRAVHLRLSGGGTFPDHGRPQVLWVGIVGAGGSDGEPELQRLSGLAKATARAARQAGARLERRPFRPHLTLGRWRPGDHTDRAVAAALADYHGPPFRLTEVVLMRSHLGPNPRYERLAAWPLPLPPSRRPPSRRS
jgi:2'-5' RNA ligase